MNFATVPITEPLDPTFVKEATSTLPWYQIEGLINVRQLPIQHSPGLILRSGEPNHLTDKGKAQLAEIGIKKIFDLRSLNERQKFAESTFEIPGIEIVHVPALDVAQQDDLGLTFQRFAKGGIAPFVDSYTEILKQGVPSFKIIFQHIRDRLPLGEGCVIHCTAGKDRTGVAVMVILDVIGLSDDEIVQDYTLTRIGLETGRETLVTRFQKLLDDPDVRVGALNAFSCPPSAMEAVLKVFHDSFGGSEGYLKNQLGFSEDDIRTIKSNLLGQSRL